LFSYFTEQLPCKIIKQVKKSMPTYNEKSFENLLCLEESEMSDKTALLEKFTWLVTEKISQYKCYTGKFTDTMREKNQIQCLLFVFISFLHSKYR
jgi:hypothetical protein